MLSMMLAIIGIGTSSHESTRPSSRCPDDLAQNFSAVAAGAALEPGYSGSIVTVSLFASAWRGQFAPLGVEGCAVG
jgi:uncharacterized membrane protein